MRILMATAALGVLLAGCSDKDDAQIQYFNCGETPIKITDNGAQMTLNVDDAAYVLMREGEGEDVAYKSQGEAGNVVFTPTTEGGALEINGDERPACRAVVWQDNDNVTHFKAFGNEPGWMVEISPDLFKVMRGMDGQTYAQSRTGDVGLKRSYSLKDGDIKISIKSAPKSEPCRDTMSGQYFAYTVTMKMDGETFNGCGDSAPAYETQTTPLTQAVWILEDIDGKGIIDGSNVNIRINARGFVNADAMCERFSAPYSHEGSTIKFETFEQIGRRGCRSEALREQQTRFMDILGNTSHYAYQMDGGMVLFTQDGRTLLFRER